MEKAVLDSTKKKDVHDLLSEDPWRAALAQTLSELALGVILVDEQSQVLWLNPAAQRVISTGDSLRITGGRLRGQTPKQTQVLHGLVAQRASANASCTAHVMPLTSLTVGLGIAPVVVLAFATENQPCNSPVRPPAAAVLIADEAHPRVVPPEQLRIYGLTRTEAKLASWIGSGGTLEGYCSDHSVSLSTARWHLKRILPKLACTRQAELVRFVQGSALAWIAPGAQLKK